MVKYANIRQWPPHQTGLEIKKRMNKSFSLNYHAHLDKWCKISSLAIDNFDKIYGPVAARFWPGGKRQPHSSSLKVFIAIVSTDKYIVQDFKQLTKEIVISWS